MQGIETREVVRDMNKEKLQLNPGNVPQAAIMSPQFSSYKGVGDNYRLIADALGEASKYADKASANQQLEQRIDGHAQRYQGKAYQEAKTSGVYTGEGWQIADLQITANDLLANEKAKIKTDFYGTKPEDYRKYLVDTTKKLFDLAQKMPDATLKKYAADNAVKMLEQLAEDQTKEHIAYNYQKTLDSVPALMESTLANDANGLEQAKVLMLNRVKGITPKDFDSTIEKWLGNKYLQVQNQSDLNVLDSLTDTWISRTIDPSISKDTNTVDNSIIKDTPNAPAASVDVGNLPVNTSKKVDMSMPASAGAPSIEAALGFSNMHSRMTGNPNATALLNARNKAAKRVERNGVIREAAQTGYFGTLSGADEIEAAFNIKRLEAASKVSDIPDPAAREDMIDTIYAKELSKISAVDPKVKGQINAGLGNLEPENSAVTNDAAQMLFRLMQEGGAETAMKYVTTDNKAIATRLLGYMQNGVGAADAARLAARPVDEKLKVPAKDVESAVERRMKEVEHDGFRGGIFNPLNYIPVPFGDVSQSRWSYGATPEELKAPSHQQAHLKAELTRMAELYLPDAQTPEGAVLRAESELAPRTQYVAAKPLIANKPWEQQLNDGAPRGQEIPAGALQTDPTIMNAAIMESLKNQASVFRRDRESFFGHLFKEGVSNYKTFRGANNDIVTFARGVPDYRNLEVNLAPDGDGVHIRVWQDVTRQVGEKTQTIRQLSPEYVHVSNARIRDGVNAIIRRDAMKFGTAAGITPILDRPIERDTPNANEQKSTLSDRLKTYVLQGY